MYLLKFCLTFGVRFICGWIFILSTIKAITHPILYATIATMKVYIEFVVIDNVVVTVLSSYLAYTFTGIRPKRLRTAATAIAGTLVSVFYPFWSLPTPLIVLAKILVGVLLSVVLFVRVCNVPLGALAFFASTALLAGASVAANCFISGDLGLALSSHYLPYCLPSAVSVLIYIPTAAVIKAARKKRIENSFRRKVMVTIRGTTAEMTGYIDTGNGLEDDGVPIAVVKLSSVIGKFGDDVLLRYSSGSKIVGGIGGETRLILIKPDKFLLYFDKKRNKYSDVILGISACGFGRNEDMLLPVSVLGGSYA